MAIQVETERDNEAARTAYRKSGFTEIDGILMIHQLLARQRRVMKFCNIMNCVDGRVE
jgi:hypothetical protein